MTVKDIGNYNEFVKSKYIGWNEKPIERTPFTHPYSYEAFFTWKSECFNKEDINSVSSDRMMEWDFKKFNYAVNKVWHNEGQMFYDRKPEDINEFLNIYLGKEVKLTAILQSCNVYNGYPYWTFIYKN